MSFNIVDRDLKIKSQNSRSLEIPVIILLVYLKCEWYMVFKECDTDWFVKSIKPIKDKTWAYTVAAGDFCRRVKNIVGR